MFLRLGFFSTLENPEPRYVVELFPFLSILGGIGIAFAYCYVVRHFRAHEAGSEQEEQRNETREAGG